MTVPLLGRSRGEILAPDPDDPSRHIVDALIEERADYLKDNPLVWWLIRACFFRPLGYRHALRMIDEIQGMNGREVMGYLSNQLSLSLQISGTDRIPRTGRLVVVANHPTGIADGVVIHDVLRPVRDDLVIFANRDAIRAAPGVADLVIPVEWVEEKRTRARSRETVRAMVEAFRSERCVVIFPSGRLAMATRRGLRERPWMSTAINLARKYDAPIQPIHISGVNSWLYYLLWQLNEPLRDMTLFRELLNKRGARYDVRVGRTIDPHVLDHDLEVATRWLQAHVEDALSSGGRTGSN